MATRAAGRSDVAGYSIAMMFRLQYLCRSFLRMHMQMKSLLAVLCLCISIATLMQVLALSAGIRQQMLEILADTGNRNLTITAGTVDALPGRGSGVSIARTLRMTDFQTLADASLPLANMAPVSSATLAVRFREMAVQTNIAGTYPSYFDLRHYQIERGRFLDQMDNSHLSRVAVLGARVAATLFSVDQEQVAVPGEGLGQTILIGNMPFTVVGILRPRGSGQTGISQDDVIYIPLNTALRRAFNVQHLNSIVVEVDDIGAMGSLRNGLTSLLLGTNEHGAPEQMDFSILDASQALAAAIRNQQVAASFFRVIAVLTLGMATAGIFAVNYLNVKERDGEFGLRKATGATRSGIALLVLGEMFLLGMAGGAGGVVLGLLFMAGLTALTEWILLVDAAVLLQVLAAAILASMMSALVPAWMAASKDPLVALNQR
jgi:putative ABC transport system permease protein